MIDMNAVLSDISGKTIDYTAYDKDATSETIIIYFTDGSNVEINADAMKIFLFP